MYVFQTEVYWGYLRHSGFYFIAMMMVALLSKNLPLKMVKILAFVQFIVAIPVLVSAILFPFSTGKNTVDFIKKNYTDYELNCTDMICASTLEGYMGKKIYLYGKKAETRYVQWDKMQWDGGKPLAENIRTNLLEGATL